MFPEASFLNHGGHGECHRVRSYSDSFGSLAQQKKLRPCPSRTAIGSQKPIFHSRLRCFPCHRYHECFSHSFYLCASLNDEEQMHFKCIFPVLILFFGFLVHQSTAQDKPQKFIEFSYDQGPIIGNNKDWASELIDQISYSAIDVRIGWRCQKSTVYNYVNRFPTYGIGFTSNVKHYSEIGRPMAVYGFGEFPFGSQSYLKKLNFSYYAQVGLGFGMNPYDTESNPLNSFVGTAMNIHVGFGLKGFYRLNETFGVFASAGLKHYSNGSLKKPNSGINFVPIALGVRVNFDKESFHPGEKPVFPPKEYKGYWNIAAYTGAKSYGIGEKAYFRGGLGVNYLWDFSYKYKAGIGLDWFYGAGASKRYPDEDLKVTDTNSFAVVGSWEWQLTERFYMPIAFGVYLSKAHYNEETAQYYERIGIRYRAKNNLFAGVQIKAHKAKADFFEFTVGYTIPGGKLTN